MPTTRRPIAASPSSAYTCVPERGHGPLAVAASAVGTLRTVVIRTPAAPSVAVTVRVTVWPALTAGTVSVAVDSAAPASDVKVKVIVYVYGSEAWLTIWNSAQ